MKNRNVLFFLRISYNYILVYIVQRYNYIFVHVNNRHIQVCSCIIKTVKEIKQAEVRTMTIRRFLDMALDNTFTFCVFDCAKDDIIFDSRENKEFPDEIGELEFSGWYMAGRYDEILTFNVCSKEE